ncbi:modulator of macroautophagy TMEM150B [Leptonychotes weddellii]|uniref:Modulator of macroautophagy TMEM150B n=1 Tax=Leptonychotes weddellii TaxID=9713 RepID=A0A7F8Q6N0_LEPWE|nr:modulator of macroautophagy TMEM150B [Leptonychotes weddellii]
MYQGSRSSEQSLGWVKDPSPITALASRTPPPRIYLPRNSCPFSSQQKNQLPTHLIGAFFALFVGNLYFWLQLFLFWRMRSLPQPGAPWIGPLRLGLCSLCTILMVAMVILHSWPLRSASAACEWAIATLLFTLFGLFAVDFSCLDSCTLCLQPGPSLSPPPASPISLQIPL